MKRKFLLWLTLPFAMLWGIYQVRARSPRIWKHPGVGAIFLAGDASVLVSVDKDSPIKKGVMNSVVKVWDVPANRLIADLPQNGGDFSEVLALSAAGRWLLMRRKEFEWPADFGVKTPINQSAALQLWKIGSHSANVVWTRPQNAADVRGAAFQDGQIYLLRPNVVEQLDLQGIVLKRVKLKATVPVSNFQMALSPDARVVVQDGVTEAHLFNAQTGQFLRVLKQKYGSSNLEDFEFSADGKTLSASTAYYDPNYAGGPSYSWTAWNIVTGHQTQSTTPPQISLPFQASNHQFDRRVRAQDGSTVAATDDKDQIWVQKVK